MRSWMLALVVLTAGAGALGGWIGVAYGLRTTRAAPGLDRLLNRDLALSAPQKQALKALEQAYGRQRAMYDTQIRTADHALAQALVQDHAFGPSEAAAIARIHAAMGEEQEATVKHVLAMRTVLNPAQAARFDQVVLHALSPPAS